MYIIIPNWVLGPGYIWTINDDKNDDDIRLSLVHYTYKSSILDDIIITIYFSKVKYENIYFHIKSLKSKSFENLFLKNPK